MISCRKLGAKPPCEPCKGVGFILVPADETSREDSRLDRDEDKESGYMLVAGAFDEEHQNGGR
jgi:hypothetical protein